MKNEMYSKADEAEWKRVISEFSLREVSALHDYQAAGVNSEIIIGDEKSLAYLLRDTDLFGYGFTARGKLTEERLAAFLKKAKEKYRIKVQILCVR